MRRQTHFVPAMLGLVLIITACSVPTRDTTKTLQATDQPASTVAAPHESEIHITDALGREVVLEAPPQRIVVTGKALIMVLDAIYTFPEAPDRVAGIAKAAQAGTSFVSFLDPNYEEKIVLQHDASAEQIAAIQPDLVILKSILAETTGKTLEAVDIPVIYVDFETPEQYERDIQLLGKVFQNEARAQQIIAYYQKETEQIQAALSNTTAKPNALLLYYNDEGGSVSFNIPPTTWMQTRIVEMAGGEPVWLSANPGKGWTKVSLEQIAAWDADQIFIVSYVKDPGEIVASLKADPQWQSFRAVQQGHLYAFPADFFSWDQPDMRWILGLNWLAKQLHPEVFSGLDIIQQAQEFYQVLYGLDPNFFDMNIRPLLKGDVH